MNEQVDMEKELKKMQALTKKKDTDHKKEIKRMKDENKKMENEIEKMEKKMEKKMEQEKQKMEQEKQKMEKKMEQEKQKKEGEIGSLKGQLKAMSEEIESLKNAQLPPIERPRQRLSVSQRSPPYQARRVLASPSPSPGAWQRFQQHQFQSFREFERRSSHSDARRNSSSRYQPY